MRQGDVFDRMLAACDFLPHERKRDRSAGLWRRLRSQLTQWRERARARRQLARFRPHDMHDIGITRSEIVREINKPFWRL